jgi:hypothetical protein
MNIVTSQTFYVNSSDFVATRPYFRDRVGKMASNLSQNNHLFFGDFLLFSTKICIFAAGFHNK